MKTIYVKIFTLFAIILLLISLFLNLNLIKEKKEPSENIIDNDELNNLNTDPIFEIIEKINESLIDEYLKELTINIGPRKTGTSGCELAADYIFKQFEKSPMINRIFVI